MPRNGKMLATNIPLEESRYGKVAEPWTSGRSDVGICKINLSYHTLFRLTAQFLKELHLALSFRSASQLAVRL